MYRMQRGNKAIERKLDLSLRMKTIKRLIPIIDN